MPQKKYRSTTAKAEKIIHRQIFSAAC